MWNYPDGHTKKVHHNPAHGHDARSAGREAVLKKPKNYEIDISSFFQVEHSRRDPCDDALIDSG